MKSFTLCCVGLAMFLLIPAVMRPQEDFKTRERSIVTIEKGIKLHDGEKYEEAIAEYKKVHRNDSNYYVASIEILNSYLLLKKNQEGLDLCDQLLKLKNDYTPNILIFKGDFLDNLNRHAEAQKIYEQGAKDYPLNHSFYYEMAVSKLNQRKYDEAYALLIKTLRINPFHAASHHQMGLLAYRNNNIVCTMLAFQFYLLCDGTTKKAQGIVGDLERIVKLELETDSVRPVKAFETENDFTELESIIKSKVALGNSYKSKIDIKYALIKQIQVLMDNIGKYKDVKGFYNEFYGKFFSELQSEKYFEPFAYDILQGMELQDVNKWLQKNKTDVQKFEVWAYNYSCKKMANYPENLNGKMVSVPHWFSNNYISAAGDYNAQEKQNGYWNFYFRNGIKKSEGEFVDGAKNGTWKYFYQAGGIKEEAVYDKGAEKMYKSFYANNNPVVEVNIITDKVDGLKQSYFSNGNIYARTEYKLGEINGTQTYYYRNGSSRYTIKNNKEILNGDLVEYFDNGKIYQKVTFVNSNREGAAKKFWNNAGNTVETEGNYIKNEKTGEWKSYYRSGTLSKEEHFDEKGYYDGVVKNYYENGKVESEAIYSSGKYNGLSKEYTEDGVLQEELLYKKGKLLEYRAYKKDGTKICDNKINGKNFQVVLYHANGNKRREGKVTDGELDGIWKDYSTLGILEKETNYKDGKLEGIYSEYHSNGKLKRKRVYVDDTENGYYVSYYLNGQMETEGMIVDGKNEGYWKNYYKNGTLQSYQYYVGDEIDGWNEYYDVNGKLSSEELYSETCRIKIVYHDTTGAVQQNIDLPGGNGLIERKTADGKIIFSQTYLKDYPDGFTRSFYPDGKTETEVEYKKGKKEGKRSIYNGVGVKTNETNFFNNMSDGMQYNYFDNGKVSSEYTYVKGELHGNAKIYHENGKLQRDINYNFGDAEGESSLYDDFGELVYKRIFHKDFLVGYTYKDAKGQFLKPIEVGAGDVKMVCYFQNGSKSLEGMYSNGELNGKRTMYYSNGKIMDESEFYFGWNHGPSKTYYANGNLKETENYYYGKQEGKRQTFYENGKLKTEESYKQGSEHGWFKYYDANGKLIKSILYYNADPILVK